MNLGEFHTLISAEVKRGNSLDTIIPLRVAMAAKMLERNYSMQYMRTYIEVAVNKEDVNSRVVSLPTDIKSVGWLRYLDSNNYYQSIKLIDPRDIAQLISGPPSGYSLSGRSSLILDKTPDANYTISGEVKFFTAWPTDNSAAPWLVSQAFDILMAQTMILIGNYLRDTGIVAQYRGWRDECLKTLMNSEAEISYDGLDTEMAYAPFYGFPTTGN